MLIERLSLREHLEAILFSQKDELGGSLYFPMGLLRTGYVVASNDQKERIPQSYIRRADLLIVVMLVAALIIVLLDLPVVTILPLGPFSPTRS